MSVLPTRREVLEVAKSTMQKYFEGNLIDHEDFKAIAKEITTAFAKGGVSQDTVVNETRKKLLGRITVDWARAEIQARLDAEETTASAAGESSTVAASAVEPHAGVVSPSLAARQVPPPVLGARPLPEGAAGEAGVAPPPTKADDAQQQQANVVSVLSGFRKHLQKAKQAAPTTVVDPAVTSAREDPTPKPSEQAAQQPVAATSVSPPPPPAVPAASSTAPAAPKADSALVAVAQERKQARDSGATVDASAPPVKAARTENLANTPTGQARPTVPARAPVVAAAVDDSFDVYGDVPTPVTAPKTVLPPPPFGQYSGGGGVGPTPMYTSSGAFVMPGVHHAVGGSSQGLPPAPPLGIFLPPKGPAMTVESSNSSPFVMPTATSYGGAAFGSSSNPSGSTSTGASDNAVASGWVMPGAATGGNSLAQPAQGSRYVAAPLAGNAPAGHNYPPYY